MVQLFNFYYFLYVIFAFGLLFGLYFFLRNKNKKTSSLVLFSILFSAFVMHFLRLTFDSYQQWMPYAIRMVTPENICAVSVLVFPWIFLSKNMYLKDYMFYLGFISGIAATFFPIDVIGFRMFEPETIRFYHTHIILWVIPTLMVMLKLHTLDYKRIPKIPLLALAMLGVILVNEIILIGTGFVPMHHLFSNQVRNSALIFGPLADVELVGRMFTAMTPDFFLTVPVGPRAGEVFYWPILWLAIPFYIYASIAALLLSLPFEYKNIKDDILSLKVKIKSKLERISKLC